MNTSYVCPSLTGKTQAIVGGVESPKLAVTVVAVVIVTMQVPVPVQPPPLQPVKVDPVAAEAVRVTGKL